MTFSKFLKQTFSFLWHKKLIVMLVIYGLITTMVAVNSQEFINSKVVNPIKKSEISSLSSPVLQNLEDYKNPNLDFSCSSGEWAYTEFQKEPITKYDVKCKFAPKNDDGAISFNILKDEFGNELKRTSNGSSVFIFESVSNLQNPKFVTIEIPLEKTYKIDVTKKQKPIYIKSTIALANKNLELKNSGRNGESDNCEFIGDDGKVASYENSYSNYDFVTRNLEATNFSKVNNILENYEINSIFESGYFAGVFYHNTFLPYTLVPTCSFDIQVESTGFSPIKYGGLDKAVLMMNIFKDGGNFSSQLVPTVFGKKGNEFVTITVNNKEFNQKDIIQKYSTDPNCKLNSTNLERVRVYGCMLYQIRNNQELKNKVFGEVTRAIKTFSIE
jgi:hypothetical protein